MKYIIEIEDEPFVRKSALHGEEALYRAKGFRSLVFDEKGLEKLTPYRYREQDNTELKPGDEIQWYEGVRAVVLDVDESTFYELDENGCVDQQCIPEPFKNAGYYKTGRNFSEFDAMLKKMIAG